MRILVYPHDLGIGGSQINAIDLAAAAAAHGHEVIVYGVPGPLVGLIEQRGLRFVAAHAMRYRPAPTRIAQLARLARRERTDLIHAYEWPPCLDAYFGAGLALGVPLLCTVLSMSVMPYVPASVPLVMGTAALGRAARAAQRAEVAVLEPPIDTRHDHPGIDGAAWRRRHGIGIGEPLVVTVSRLALDLKLDALVRAIDAAGLLADRRPLRWVLVGDGPARDALRERALAVNRRCGREVVSLVGAALDPRGAYAAADVVVGMGSSALRAMAIGRPLVVQGEGGFSKVFEPDALGHFLEHGFYGVADGSSGPQRLAAQVERLLDDAGLAAALGVCGRSTVVERFSLQRAIPLQLAIYERVASAPCQRGLRDAFAAARQALKLEIVNHDPRAQRARRTLEQTLMTAAGRGHWPPAFT